MISKGVMACPKCGGDLTSITRNGACVCPPSPLNLTVLERVGRYMAVIGLNAYADATCGYTHGKVRIVQPLRHFAADVLDKLVADGQRPEIMMHVSLHDKYHCDVASVMQEIEVPTWPEAVLLAAAAVQERRE